MGRGILLVLLFEGGGMIFEWFACGCGLKSAHPLMTPCVETMDHVEIQIQAIQATQDTNTTRY